MSHYHRALIALLIFAALGLLLSGYLSYWNYFKPGCAVGPLNWLVTCGGPKAVKIFGQPTCIYGFGMFLAVFITALIGLNKIPSGAMIKTLIMLGLAGTLFSGFLSVYEIWFLKIEFTALPACVYGLIFYLGILISSIVGSRKLMQELSPDLPIPPPPQPY